VTNISEAEKFLSLCFDVGGIVKSAQVSSSKSRFPEMSTLSFDSVCQRFLLLLSALILAGEL
jgi:hypothetical protein